MNNLKKIFSKISTPTKQEVRSAIQSFSKGRFSVFLIFLCVFFVSGISLLGTIVLRPFQVEIPVHGGVHREGVVGNPRFVNPVLSSSNADKDVESLVFAGLARKTREGSIVLDLAEDFSVSDDNLTYIFTINKEAKFHDNTQVTAEDVVYTINQIQNPEIKSPKRVLWEGVEVTALDDVTVRFKLTQPFIGFLENTTTGILPAHIWENIPDSEFAFASENIQAIGSGRYKITSSTKSANGGVSSYSLKTARQYIGDEPYIRKIKIRFFEDEESALKALKNKDVYAVSGLSASSIDKIPKNSSVYTATLHRMFGIFFNQESNPALADKRVRQAINAAIDRQQVIQYALGGFGEAITSPLPTTIQTNNKERTQFELNTDRANALLDQAGWSKTPNGTRIKQGSELSFTLTTGSIKELERAAESIKQQLSDVGITVTINILGTADLNQNIIRPRNFEILLFGQIINQESDLFAFWHSSQTADPGLNISNYKNKTVDSDLEEIVQTFDPNKRAILYNDFEKQFFNDIPALFLYSPQLIYVVRGTLHNVELSPITNSSQRLLDMQEWYSQTDFVLPAFNK